jgi:hypothetical protein
MEPVSCLAELGALAAAEPSGNLQLPRAGCPVQPLQSLIVTEQLRIIAGTTWRICRVVRGGSSVIRHTIGRQS